MIDQQKLSIFKDLFAQAESVFIIHASDALRDHLFAATALYKTFQQLGTKEVTLLSSQDLSRIETDIAYLEEAKTEIGHENLCITLDYIKESVEKITSSIDEDAQKLYITIKPQKNLPPLVKENISFSYTGAQADMIILVGVDDLVTLEQLYIGYENLYHSTALVSINSYETAFGNLKLDILGSSCVSEYVAELLKNLDLQLDQEVATNLLAGIDEETNNLESYLATADTFEVVSYLLRSGARRFARENKLEPEQEEQGYGQADGQEDSVAQEYGDVQGYGSVQEDNAIQEHDVAVEATTPAKKKQGRGRPKGSKNKVKSNPKDTKPKPGDLNYTPSGLGPSSGG